MVAEEEEEEEGGGGGGEEEEGEEGTFGTLEPAYKSDRMCHPVIADSAHWHDIQVSRACAAWKQVLYNLPPS